MLIFSNGSSITSIPSLSSLIPKQNFSNQPVNESRTQKARIVPALKLFDFQSNVWQGAQTLNLPHVAGA